MECQFDFSLSNQCPVRTGFLLCLPACWTAVLCMTSADLWRLRSRHETAPTEQAFCCITGKGRRQTSALCFNQHIDGIQPRRRLPCSSSAVRDGMKNRRSDSDIRRLPFRQRKTPRIRIFRQRVTLMAAFFRLRHRPPCGLLLCAEGNQCP